MWPGGAEGAVALTFDFDAEQLWEGSRLSDRSQGTYGARVGIPQILRILDRHRLPSTFFVVGKVAEDHGQQVRDILASGHEVALHGHTHRAPATLSEEVELRELRQGRSVLAELGAEVEGYRAPDWGATERTLRLLDTEGFAYSSNLMDDIRPYRHPGTELIELPVHWALDDAPYFWFDGRSWERTITRPEDALDVWIAELEGIRDLGGCAVLTLHPQIIGRPGRLRILDALLGSLDSPRSWVATCRDIAGRIRKSPD